MSTQHKRGTTTSPITLNTVKIFAVRNGKSLILKTKNAQEAYKKLKESREGHQSGGTGTAIEIEGISEYDLHHIAMYGRCPVYGGCVATGHEPTPLKSLGGGRWLHLQLGLTLKGRFPKDSEGCDYLEVI